MTILLERLKNELEQIKGNQRQREEKILKSEMESSEGFLSTWGNHHTTDLLETKIAILENGGLWNFSCLCDLEGNKVPNSKLVKTKFGRAYRVEKEDGSVDWVNPIVQEKTLRKKGYTIGTELLPAWAKLDGSGKGLAGALTVHTVVFPSKKNYLYELE
ncbi:hypothetical protein [Virgibacillus halodenitrificans]|uniref:hypothetical protein n=1 Tax=Virgibacillus halodenitrificans TaxID=1482 RepID=UPI000EF53FA4|nr:hypothetical protein [Virgibacillus halodenitrificans]